MTRRMDSTTYVLRTIAAVLAVILALCLLWDVINTGDEPLNRKKLISEAIGLVLAVASVVFLSLNPPE